MQERWLGSMFCCDFEDEPRELAFIGIDQTLLSLSGAWSGRNLHETIQQFFDTEIIEG